MHGHDDVIPESIVDAPVGVSDEMRQSSIEPDAETRRPRRLARKQYQIESDHDSDDGLGDLAAPIQEEDRKSAAKDSEGRQRSLEMSSPVGQRCISEKEPDSGARRRTLSLTTATETPILSGASGLKHVSQTSAASHVVTTPVSTPAHVTNLSPTATSTASKTRRVSASPRAETAPRGAATPIAHSVMNLGVPSEQPESTHHHVTTSNDGKENVAPLPHHRALKSSSKKSHSGKSDAVVSMKKQGAAKKKPSGRQRVTVGSAACGCATECTCSAPRPVFVLSAVEPGLADCVRQILASLGCAVASRVTSATTHVVSGGVRTMKVRIARRRCAAMLASAARERFPCVPFWLAALEFRETSLSCFGLR